MNTSTQSPPRSRLPLHAHGWLAAIILLAVLSPAVHAQHQLWLGQFGSSADDLGYAIAPDGAGGFVVSGDTWGDLGGPNAGSADAFLARYNAEGIQLWLRQFGTDKGEQTSDVEPDGAGGVYITGDTWGNLGGPHLGINDGFIARYDGDGTQLWVRHFGTTTYDFVGALAQDGTGGVFVAGTTQGNFGGPSTGGADAFLAHYDGDGNQLWVTQFGSGAGDVVEALAPDGAGGVYMAGRTTGSLGGQHAGSSDAFLIRLDSTGNQLWARQFGTPTSDYAESVVSDGAGGAIISGSTLGNLFGTNEGSMDAFLTRFDGDGTQLWADQFGTAESDFGRAIAADGAGGALVTGSTGGALAGMNSGKQDLYLARYDSAGERVWIRQFGSSEYDASRSLINDGAGNAVLAGYSKGSLAGPNAGGWDVCMARMPIDYCYADCDQSTGNGALDIFDFLCFQNNFVAGESYACDCDTSTGPGICDVFDFLGFQDAFVNGCP